MATDLSQHKKLHVLIAGISWPPETFLARLIDGLLASGIEITTACASKPGENWLKRPGFSWLPAPDTRRQLLQNILPYTHNILRTLMHNPAAFARDWRLMQAAKPAQGNNALLAVNSLLFSGGVWDIIYFPWNSSAIQYEQLFSLDLPAVISCRGSQINIAPHDPTRRAFKVGLVRTLNKATLVHCVSNAILDEAAKLGMDPAKARVIRPAVDPQVFTPPEHLPNNNRFAILSTGSLIWRKDYQRALMAIRHLVDLGVDAEYHIIGDGPERQQVLYTIQDLDLNNRVILHGQMAAEEVVKQLQNADAFLLSSLSEGISNAVLEAMSCSLPIVTTDCGGMREAVTDGVEGFVVPIMDHVTMAEAMQKIATDRTKRISMGMAGREKIISGFNLSDQIASWVNLFSEVMERAK